MTNPSDDQELGAAISDPDLARLFSELRMVTDQPAPVIGDELAAILAGASPDSAPARRTRSRRLALAALVSTGALAAGVGAAAATDRLPAPMQRVVAKVVNGVTPFDMRTEPAQSEPRIDPTTPAGDDETSEHDASDASDDEPRDRPDDSEDDRSTGDSQDDDGADQFDDDDGGGDSDDGGNGGDDDSDDDGDSDDGGDGGDGDSGDNGDSEDDSGNDSESDD